METPWTRNPSDYRPPTLEAPAPKPAQQTKGVNSTAGFKVRGASDQQLSQKMALLRDKIIRPALGPGPGGLAFTRGLLVEALGKAPAAVNGHHKAAEAVRIFEWVRHRFRYVNDPTTGELFQQLPDMVKAGMGDCEDFTALLVAMFEAAGIKARARVIGIKGARGWAHIYPLALLGGRWRAFDATEKHRAGWEYPNPTRRLDVELT